MRHLVELFSRYTALNTKVPTEAVDTVRAVRHPGYLADLLAAHVVPDPHERQAVLAQAGDRRFHCPNVHVEKPL